MSEQKPRRVIGSYWRTPSPDQGEQRPRKVTGSYFRQPGNESAPAQQEPATPPYGSLILGLNTDTGQPVYVSQVDRYSGMYILGVQGTGKSSLLQQLITQDIKEGNAVIVIDPHNDLIDHVLETLPESRVRDTYLLDVLDESYPFALNVFSGIQTRSSIAQMQAVDRVSHLFDILWGDIFNQQSLPRYLRAATIALFANPGSTLVDMYEFLLSERKREQMLEQVNDPSIKQFWQRHDSLTDAKKREVLTPLLTRLEVLFTGRPLITNIVGQAETSIDIRRAIENKEILLIKLPLKTLPQDAALIGTILLAQIHAAIFSFADLPQESRPGFSLFVDEFQHFATPDFSEMFTEGRKFGSRVTVAHQYREQLPKTATNNLQSSTLTARTKICFQLSPEDATNRDLTQLFMKLAETRRPTDLFIHPLERIKRHKDPTVKRFILDVVDKLEDAAGESLETVHEYYTEKRYRRYRGHGYTEEVPRSFTHKENPPFDFGAGVIRVNPDDAARAFALLDTLIFESEDQRHIVPDLKEQFLAAVSPFWKLDPDGKIPDPKYPDNRSMQRNQTAAEKAQARQRKASFIQRLDTVLTILINKPIAEDAELTSSDIATLLQHLEKQHALVRTESQAYSMKTLDMPKPTTAARREAAKRLEQITEQTRLKYCRPVEEIQNELAPQVSPDEQDTQEDEQPEQPAHPEPDITVAIEPEPVEEVSEPEVPKPQPEAVPEPEQPQIQLVPESRDSVNLLFTQLQKREIDPDTTILAALGEHYVLTIKQWMRLFERSALPKATPYFKTLREQGYIYRKDREGRGGALITGDWLFLLTKGANELARRKQRAPLFKLEPNEAEKAAGDTLVHTSLVNEVLIHLRLLERQYPGIITIEKIIHERMMRREYLAALGTDSKLYPDGFLRLLVPTPNGLKKRYLFLELQHTTQKDKQNWQSKVRKYLDLFAHEDTLTHYFATRTPRVLVLVMDEEYIALHKQWTEEVLQQAGEKGKRYSNRFLIGSYDKGIADNTMQPLKFFCTDRFFVPQSGTTTPLFYRVK